MSVRGLLRWRAQDRRRMLMSPPVFCDTAMLNTDAVTDMRPGDVVMYERRPTMTFLYPPRRPEVRA